MDFDFEKFKEDQRDALLSLNLSKINAYLAQYGSPPLPDNVAAWAGIHKARAALPLPEEERQKSRDWLREHGFKELGK